MRLPESNEISILLEGREGLFMLEDALELVSKLFCSEYYEKHPDYLFVDLKDKKTIGVDEITPVIEKGLMKPVLASKAVVVINHMDALTEAAQNKLLLTLEESPYLFIIGISYQNRLLDTVLSRMKRTSYQPLSQKEFLSVCEGDIDKDDAVLLFHACSGCPGLIPAMKEELPMFRAVLNACLGKRSGLFSALHLVKEKDKLAITEHKELILPVFRIMQHGLLERALRLSSQGDSKGAIGCAKLVRLIEGDMQVCNSSAYSKDNLFRTICCCVEQG